jgi:hypothetical protein
MEGVMNMNKFKHYGKDVWRQASSIRNWVKELKESGLEYTALPDLEHEVYKYIKDGNERYALVYYPDVPEEALQEVYIIEKIPDDLSWDNIIEDYRQQSRGYDPMKLPTRARLLYDEAFHRAYEWEKEDNPDFAKNFWHRPAGYVDPEQFKLAIMSLGTSIEELREMDHSDTPEIDELEL